MSDFGTMQQRIAELEAENAALKAKLAEAESAVMDAATEEVETEARGKRRK